MKQKHVLLILIIGLALSHLVVHFKQVNEIELQQQFFTDSLNVIDSSYNLQLEAYKAENQRLENQILNLDSVIENELVELTPIRDKIRQSINTDWSNLPRDEKAAYVEYIINRYKSKTP